ncbi:hydroxymethylglutaryl-CoA lyase [candidate division KSB1 bacterium]|nr:hydroxymethylglutaryl-CoA lyase [candidate division KSB1 bacterium]
MKKITIHEVGMRDGLQMEEKLVSLDTKIAWINQLLDSGVDIIQIGSFVHPKYVPQMAETDDLFRHFSASGRNNENVVLSGLVLNEKGLERGLKCGVDMFCMGVSASETHSFKNTKMTVDEALTRIVKMALETEAADKIVQVSVQSAFGCGYEGPIAVSQVERIVNRYVDAGLRNISLADTAGHASPAQVEKLLETVLKIDDQLDITCHFHNTYGMGLANCFSALKMGVTTFEASFAGLGGCPFTAIAGGNVCTEDLVHMLQRTGQSTHVNVTKLIALAKEAADHFNREMDGKIYKTGALTY